MNRPAGLWTKVQEAVFQWAGRDAQLQFKGGIDDLEPFLQGLATKFVQSEVARIVAKLKTLEQHTVIEITEHYDKKISQSGSMISLQNDSKTLGLYEHLSAMLFSKESRRAADTIASKKRSSDADDLRKKAKKMQKNQTRKLKIYANKRTWRRQRRLHLKPPSKNSRRRTYSSMWRSARRRSS